MFDSFWWWIILGGVFLIGLLLGGVLYAWPRVRDRNLRMELEQARQAFHRHREWLEAKFLSVASQSGKPRGLRWADCDFEDDVAFARERRTGRLRALVGVSIQFEAVEGGGMEEVEAVGNRKAATVVFRLDGPDWEVDGKALFNLNPAQTIEQFQHELEEVK
jgi:hypothetical protein